MKISISVNSLSIPGGLQNWARTVSDELLRLNHRVTVVTDNIGTYAQVFNCEVTDKFPKCDISLVNNKDFLERSNGFRIFSDKKVPDKLVKKIIDLSKLAPSSCDRKAVEIKIVDSRDDKQLLGGLLVGGVGWIHRADRILLLLANKEAYKENLDYMPYLDAGVMINQIYLICTELDLKCCYVNPNVRENHLRYFQDFIDNKLFCGAIAIGYEDI